ncbi:MAG: alpha/beta hydrolase [Candidatus Limnocylindrales bacterium]|nr:alpha/beta hydrolase [Candidatus Limnocylindrales bacterium]
MSIPARAVEPVRLAHEVHGYGPPLVLLAGTGYAGATWGDDLVGRLAEQFTVVTLDYRGTGKTPGTDEDYSTRLFAADAVRLIDELGMGPAHVLGHSMGGRVAQWVAIDAPDRVRSLVLAASGPGEYRADCEPQPGIPLANAIALIEKGYERTIADQIRSTFFTPEFAASSPAKVDRLIQAFWDNRASLRDYLKHVIARQGHRTVDRLAEIDQPCLVIVGDRDTHVGGTGSHLDQSRHLADHLPRAVLRIAEGVAHGLFWQTPDPVIAEVVAFLEPRPPRA